MHLCKSCAKAYSHSKYLKRASKVYETNLARRALLAAEVDKLKTAPCTDCGKVYEPSCMDFDHLRDKVLPVSKMVHEYYSLAKIKAEIEKCELVCVLCHRHRTYLRLQGQPKATTWACYHRNLKIATQAKSVPCATCGDSFPPWQMDFDHVTGDKVCNVSALMLNSQERLEAELAKCQVLCALCHRRKTRDTLWGWSKKRTVRD